MELMANLNRPVPDEYWESYIREMKAAHVSAIAALSSERDRLMAEANAEIARLREALCDIVNLGGAYGSANYAEKADAIARAALEKS